MLHSHREDGGCGDGRAMGSTTAVEYEIEAEVWNVKIRGLLALTVHFWKILPILFTVAFLS